MPYTPANRIDTSNFTDETVTTLYGAAKYFGRQYQNLRGAMQRGKFRVWYVDGKPHCRIGDVRKYLESIEERHGQQQRDREWAIGNELFHDVMERGVLADNELLQRIAEEATRRARLGHVEEETEGGEELPSLPTLPGMSTRQFGVELEIVAPCRKRGDFDEEALVVQSNDIVQAMCVEGLPTKEGKYSEHSTTFWLVKRDSSCGLELVSPLLIGTNGIKQVKTACRVLRETGQRVDKRCALHVHWSVKDSDINFFRRLVVLYHRFEGVIDQLMPPSRRGAKNLYARSMRTVTPGQIAACATVEDLSHLYDFVRTYDNSPETFTECRSVKINVSKYPTSGTVEFRQHAGTLNAQKVVTWIRFTNAMVEFAKGDRAIPNGGDLRTLARLIGLEADVKKALEERVAELAS